MEKGIDLLDKSWVVNCLNECFFKLVQCGDQKLRNVLAAELSEVGGKLRWALGSFFVVRSLRLCAEALTGVGPPRGVVRSFFEEGVAGTGLAACDLPSSLRRIIRSGERGANQEGVDIWGKSHHIVA